MATIVLQPGETFEHYHSAPSQTIHVRGDIEFSVDGSARLMRPRESISVPGNTKHSVRNLGARTAEVTCVGTGPEKHHIG